MLARELRSLLGTTLLGVVLAACTASNETQRPPSTAANTAVTPVARKDAAQWKEWEDLCVIRAVAGRELAIRRDQGLPKQGAVSAVHAWVGTVRADDTQPADRQFRSELNTYLPFAADVIYSVPTMQPDAAGAHMYGVCMLQGAFESEPTAFADNSIDLIGFTLQCQKKNLANPALEHCVADAVAELVKCERTKCTKIRK
jgi:hypothetical protein